jgi:hypothetical protein
VHSPGLFSTLLSRFLSRDSKRSLSHPAGSIRNQSFQPSRSCRSTASPVGA